MTVVVIVWTLVVKGDVVQLGVLEVILAGVLLAAIANLTERVVQVVAHDTHPILSLRPSAAPSLRVFHSNII